MSGAETRRVRPAPKSGAQPQRREGPAPGVEVRPFRALLYDRRRLADPSAVLAPPYDVIDAAEKQLLLRRHPYNCVRLILPEAPPGEPPETRYAWARRLLRCWLCEGMLREMEEPAVFVLREEFELEGSDAPQRSETKPETEPNVEAVRAGRRYRRTSFIAAVRLQPLGGGPIYPHEETMGEAKRDRLALLEATRTNLSLVMAFFADYGTAGGEPGAVTAVLQEAQGEEPLLRAVGPQGVQLTLWAVTRSDLISRLASEMAQRELFIADGHHRYETALAFARREGALGSSDPQEAGFVPMQCIAMEDPGLLALPTHRLFPARLTTDEAGFLAQARRYFTVEEVETPGLGLSRLRELMFRRRAEHVFGLYGRSRRAYLLRLRPEVSPEELDMPYEGEARLLDVCLFQELIVKRIFGMEFSRAAKDGTLRFVHSFPEAQQRVESGEIGLAFLVNPTPVTAIPLVARRGGVMPPKSTYFFPKVPAGLLFRLIR